MSDHADRIYNFVDKNWVSILLGFMFLCVFATVHHFAATGETKAFDFAADAGKGILAALLLSLRAGSSRQADQKNGNGGAIAAPVVTDEPKG